MAREYTVCIRTPTPPAIDPQLSKAGLRFPKPGDTNRSNRAPCVEYRYCVAFIQFGRFFCTPGQPSGCPFSCPEVLCFFVEDYSFCWHLFLSSSPLLAPTTKFLKSLGNGLSARRSKTPARKRLCLSHPTLTTAFGKVRLWVGLAPALFREPFAAILPAGTCSQAFTNIRRSMPTSLRCFKSPKAIRMVLQRFCLPG